jgi:hypothetical protein
MSLILIITLAISSVNVIVVPGVANNVPVGYTVSNLDPTFNSTLNNQIYDPNFLPGFEAGLTNTSVSWSSGNGYADLAYAVGPWTHEQSGGIPHLAVGPQCCNFEEIPHTQQFRRVEWGDYYFVRAGFSSPGVNVENYTTDFSAPAYVGLRTDWDWKVQFSMNWTAPVMMDSANEWGAIGISVTQYVPSAPGNLVSTLINFWMDSNSSKYAPLSTDGSGRRVSSNVVTYHPVQISEVGNSTITLDISPYLEDTLQVLGFQNVGNEPPVISYVYLNVEGYNFAWNTTLWSFYVMSQQKPLPSTGAIPWFAIAFVALLSMLPVYWRLRRRSQPSHD